MMGLLLYIVLVIVVSAIGLEVIYADHSKAVIVALAVAIAIPMSAQLLFDAKHH